MKRRSAKADGPLIAPARDLSREPAQAASPYKSAGEELDGLRKIFRSACDHYAKRIDQGMLQLRERIAVEGEREMEAAIHQRAEKRRSSRDDIGQARLHDLRDMIGLLRTLEVKPLAGRRKDLKKIESLVDELKLLVERWG